MGASSDADVHPGCLFWRNWCRTTMLIFVVGDPWLLIWPNVNIRQHVRCALVPFLNQNVGAISPSGAVYPGTMNQNNNLNGSFGWRILKTLYSLLIKRSTSVAARSRSKFQRWRYSEWCTLSWISFWWNYLDSYSSVAYTFVHLRFILFVVSDPALSPETSPLSNAWLIFCRKMPAETLVIADPENRPDV